MLEEDVGALTHLLRLELTAVHQQFFHMLALRQWKESEVLDRVSAIDTEDFKNAMQIIDLLVRNDQTLSLSSHEIFPGSDIASIVRSELQMEERIADNLAEITVTDPHAQARVKRASEPRREYKYWLRKRVDLSRPQTTEHYTSLAVSKFLAHLIALVEQPMLHAFLLWHQGNQDGADNAWRLSGAAMLYGTALVRRGALSGQVPTPTMIPAVKMSPSFSEAFEADIELVKRCATLGRKAEKVEQDEGLKRLCRRIADDCDLISEMNIAQEFPAVFGRSPVFECFAATREKHLN